MVSAAIQAGKACTASAALDLCISKKPVTTISPSIALSPQEHRLTLQRCLAERSFGKQVSKGIGHGVELLDSCDRRAVERLEELSSLRSGGKVIFDLNVNVAGSIQREISAPLRPPRGRRFTHRIRVESSRSL